MADVDVDIRVRGKTLLDLKGLHELVGRLSDVGMCLEASLQGGSMAKQFFPFLR